MSTSALIVSEIQKLAPSAIVEVFELDTTSIGGDVFYFHAGTNGLSANITWQGQAYVRYPIEASGFEFTSNGQLPRPKLRVSNVMGTITALLLAYDDLMGAKITRKRTLVKFLDAVNFAGGVNATADSTATFENDVYFIDRKSSENKVAVEFELASAIDLAGVRIPLRQVIQNICLWKYRGIECGYTGAPLWDANDNLLTAATTAAGQLMLDTYAAKEAASVALDAADVVLSGYTQAKDNACTYQLVETRYSIGAPPVGGLHSLVLVADQSSDPPMAFWNGALVTLGTTYQVGTHFYKVANGFDVGAPTTGHLWLYMSIGRYAVDTAACTAATTTYTTALTARNAAATALATAQTNFDSALAALPLNDPLYTRDKCGKRLSSCKLRFGANNELRFGAFPSVGLIR